MHTQIVDRLLTLQSYTSLGTNAYEVYFVFSYTGEIRVITALYITLLSPSSLFVALCVLALTTVYFITVVSDVNYIHFYYYYYYYYYYY